MAAMNPDKPVEAKNVPTPTPPTLTRGQFTSEQINQRVEQLRRAGKSGDTADATLRLEAESQLKAESESRPVSGTDSRPYVDEPGKQLNSRTKVQDPSAAAAQTRSATDEQAKRSAGKIRNQ